MSMLWNIPQYSQIPRNDLGHTLLFEILMSNIDQMLLLVTTCSSYDLPPHGQYVTYHLQSVNPPTAGIQSDSHKISEAKVMQNIFRNPSMAGGTYLAVKNEQSVTQLSISKYIPAALLR